jgi:MYXO-CTERM domain-containing protein
MTAPMITRRIASASLGFFASSAALLFTGMASAGQSCMADATCPLGFTCQVVGASGCAEPNFYCPPGEPCPTPPPCVTQEIRECAPAPCDSDANCGSGMVCYTQTSQNCSGASAPPCASGTDCPPPPVEQCTTTATRTCVPKYLLPCTTATDCGTGFTCDHDRDCGCSASGGGSAPSSGSAGSAGNGGSAGTDPPANPAPPPDCSCTTLPTAHCTPTEVTCVSNADCPSQWTCEHGMGGTACGAPVNPDGTTGPTTCTTTTSPNFCAPPYFSLIGSRGGSDVSLGGGNTGIGAGASGSSTGSAGGPTQGGDPATPTSGTGGQTGLTESGNDQKTGARSPSNGGESGGCQIGSGAGATSPNAIWWGLLGLVGLVTRRRARA